MPKKALLIGNGINNVNQNYEWGDLIAGLISFKTSSICFAVMVCFAFPLNTTKISKVIIFFKVVDRFQSD